MTSKKENGSKNNKNKSEERKMWESGIAQLSKVLNVVGQVREVIDFFDKINQDCSNEEWAEFITYKLRVWSKCLLKHRSKMTSSDIKFFRTILTKSFVTRILKKYGFILSITTGTSIIGLLTCITNRHPVGIIISASILLVNLSIIVSNFSLLAFRELLMAKRNERNNLRREGKYCTKDRTEKFNTYKETGLDEMGHVLS